MSDLYNCNGSHMDVYEINHCEENGTTSSNQNHHFVVEDDVYYFVHYAVANSSEVYHLEMNVSLSSFDYDNSDSNDISCTTMEYNSCKTTRIPLELRGMAIITATIDGWKDWSYEDTIGVSWRCKGSFIGYILVFCLPFLGIIGCCNLLNLLLTGSSIAAIVLEQDYRIEIHLIL